MPRLGAEMILLAEVLPRDSTTNVRFSNQWPENIVPEKILYKRAQINNYAVSSFSI